MQMLREKMIDKANENDENDENDEKNFCKLFDFVFAKVVECQKYLSFNMMKQSFFRNL